VPQWTTLLHVPVSYEYAYLSWSVCIRLIASYWKFFLLHYIQDLCQYRLCKVDHAYLTCLMLQRQRSHLNGCKLDHHQFKPLIFSMSGFALSCTMNMFTLMILYDLCLSPTQFYYIIVYIENIESCVQIADLDSWVRVIYNWQFTTNQFILASSLKTVYGGRVKYLYHHSLASYRRWLKENSVLGGITGLPCSWGI
jgi:hypothetical protein